jgi:hypothetical protein
LEEGGFAAAAGARDGDEFAGGDAKINSSQGLDLPIVIILL